MEIKRGLKKGITGILIGGLYLLPVSHGFSQSPQYPPENTGKKDKNYTQVEGRAIVSPENEFDHKSYAKVRFVNDNLEKDTTFYADHMGIVNYSLPIEKGKDSTKYEVYAFPNEKEGSDDFVPYKTNFNISERNGLDILTKNPKNKLEEIAENED